MKRIVWNLLASALLLSGGLLANGCSSGQVRQEETSVQATPAPEASRAPSTTEQTLTPQAGTSGPGVTSLPPEPPPQEIARQVERRGPDVQQPMAPPPGSAETIPGMSRIHFDFDQSSLSAEAKNVLGRNAKFLAANPGLRVRIEGHCDERGTTEYNLALGERRAKAAFQYLMDLGIDPNRMAVVSYGEEVPLDPGQNEGAWAKNRRAEFVKFQ